MSDKWIQKANIKKGALTTTAKHEGKSLSELCSGSDLSPLTKRRCALRDTLRGLKK